MLTWGPGMNLNSRSGWRGWYTLTYQGRWPPLCPAFGHASRCHSDSPLSAGCPEALSVPPTALTGAVYATPHACTHSYGTGLGCPFCLPVYPPLCPTRTLQPRLPCDHCFRKAIPRRFFSFKENHFCCFVTSETSCRHEQMNFPPWSGLGAPHSPLGMPWPPSTGRISFWSPLGASELSPASGSKLGE